MLEREILLKDQQTRDIFVAMRAQNKSYDAICKELHISKATCTKWEKELKTVIADKKREELEALYEAYFMTKEARISQLGETLQSIDSALDNVDLTEIPPEKLLDYKLKYTQALKEEYVPTGKAGALPAKMSPEAILNAYRDLLERVQLGEVSTEQANRESMILSNTLKAYETTELQRKLETLETIVGGR